MPAGFDIGVSVAQSQAAESGGDFSTGDLILGGSGGVGRTPAWVWLALAALVLVGLLFFLPRRS